MCDYSICRLKQDKKKSLPILDSDLFQRRSTTVSLLSDSSYPGPLQQRSHFTALPYRKTRVLRLNDFLTDNESQPSYQERSEAQPIPDHSQTIIQDHNDDPTLLNDGFISSTPVKSGGFFTELSMSRELSPIYEKTENSTKERPSLPTKEQPLLPTKEESPPPAKEQPPLPTKEELTKKSAPIDLSTTHSSISSSLKPCNCRTRCNSKKRCPCRQAGVNCQNICHPGHTCTNKDTQHTKQTTITDLTKMNSSEKAGPELWKDFSGIRLYAKHKKVLESRSLWLDDQLINAAQSLLKKQHPLIGGLQTPALSSELAMIPPNSEFVQVVNVSNNHWLALSTIGCRQSTIKVFDSLQCRGLPKHIQKLVADFM